MTDPAPPTAPPPIGPPQNRYGRRGALSEETADRIVQVVSAGNHLKTAAQFAGVGQSTLLSWLARGRAAAAALDAHEPGALYCPDCGADRTTDVHRVWRHNLAADAGEQQPGSSPTYAALGRCPACHSSAEPRLWELPEEDHRYLAFLERVTQAETIAEVAAVTHWRRAFTDDWRAARDYLARRRPDQWAAKTTVSISSEEAEARIERATLEALTALGIDTPGLSDADLDAAVDGVDVDSGDPPEL